MLADDDLGGVGRLARSDLTGIRADGANLQGSILRGSKLRNSSLRGANLNKVDLSGADLRGADLTDANLQDLGFRLRSDVSTNFRGALFDEHTRLPFDRETAERMGMVFIGG